MNDGYQGAAFGATHHRVDAPRAKQNTAITRRAKGMRASCAKRNRLYS